MDALVIGSPHGLAGAVASRLRRSGARVLQALPRDAAGPERAGWLLAEAGAPALVVIVEGAPYATLHDLLGRTAARIVLVAEQRIPAAGAAPARGWLPRADADLEVVALARAGRRWIAPDARRPQPMGSERAAALVLDACGYARAAAHGTR